MPAKSGRGRARGRAKQSNPVPSNGATSTRPPGAREFSRLRIAENDVANGEVATNGIQNGAQQNGAQQNGAQQNGAQQNGAQQNGHCVNGQQRKPRRIMPRFMVDAMLKTDPKPGEDHKGVAGERIDLKTNYFRVSAKNDCFIYQYSIGFEPPCDQLSRRRGIVRRDLKDMFPSMPPIFDGMVLFYPDIAVGMDKITQREVIRHVEFGQGERAVTYTVTVKLTNELKPDDKQVQTMWNIFFGNLLREMRLLQMGRNYYDPTQRKILSKLKLEFWEGISSAIGQCESEPLLNIDVNWKAVRMDSVLDYMYEMDSQFDFDQGNVEDFYRQCESELIGQVVITQYNLKKTYVVQSISWDERPSSTFPTDQGPVSFNDYFRDRWRIDIKDQDQPLLVVGSRRKKGIIGPTRETKLVPELCNMTGIPKELIHDRQIQTLTRLNPTDRANDIMGFRKQFNGNEGVRKRMDDWGLEFGQEMVDVTGRRLPPASISFRDPRSRQIVPLRGLRAPHDWTSGFKTNLLLDGKALTNWAFVYPQRFERSVVDCLRKFNLGRKMGMTIDPPTMIALNGDSPEAYIRELRGTNYDFVFGLLPNAAKPRYDAIKKELLLENDVLNQLVRAPNLDARKIKSVMTKVLAQVNAKIGGALWKADVPAGGIMVIGMDVYHDSEVRERSATGFIASNDADMNSYYWNGCFQTSHEELVNEIGRMFKGALENYHHLNGKLPRFIIIYRDGVGDGQLAAVMEFELNQFLDCLRDNFPDYKPLMQLIVVRKRISTRFFLQGRRGDDYINPPPGTVVDSVVTGADSYDFFVISAAGNQGTVTPTKYTVIYDTTQLKPDQIQSLTWKLTHLYFNWSGTIRVPAPCQHAHTLAFKLGQHLHKMPSVNGPLQNKPWYL